MSSLRVAVVTGAGRGIGRATATRLAKDGYVVVCVDIDDTAERVAEEIDGRAVRCDVRDTDGITELAGQLDRLDLLVNNAGLWQFTPFPAISVEQYRHLMDVNVLGMLQCTQILAPIIAAGGGGSIVNVTSVLAEQVWALAGIYPMTKAAIVALTKMSANEYAKQGVRVNGVAPGLIVTDGASELYGATADERTRRGGFVPMGRLGEAADVADVIAFLGSAGARYVTGQTISVDGGLSVGSMQFLHQAWTP
jgi:NAD(P)-dependent dehydrogenase (short-subunit alcohol dehydrogenase family)